MPQIGKLTILIPVDISGPEPPEMAVLESFSSFEIIVLGYFPVPDQAEPALLKHEYEDDAGTKLDSISEGLPNVSEVLVFTHDISATIDRIAGRYECDAVLVGEDTAQINRVFVPIRGDVNIERIATVVAKLLGESETTATFFHSVSGDTEPSQSEYLLRGTVEHMTELGVDEGRVDWQLAEGGDPFRDIVSMADEYDIVILGETEPSLTERIIGDIQSRIIDEIEIPALVVRDAE